mmetsp:Transcript_24925/g.42691  ORF Transcript_24925/g.42691 Transcript_24925/m.42691 type:complete len:85 (-) Transcript_24925:87-341(-)
MGNEERTTCCGVDKEGYVSHDGCAHGESCCRRGATTSTSLFASRGCIQMVGVIGIILDMHHMYLTLKYEALIVYMGYHYPWLTC